MYFQPVWWVGVGFMPPKVMWMLRWAGVKGFLPIKPVICTTQPIELEGGASVMI